MSKKDKQDNNSFTMKASDSALGKRLRNAVFAKMKG